MDRSLIEKAAAVLSIQDVYLGDHSVKFADDFTPGMLSVATSSVFNWGTHSAVIQEITDTDKGVLAGKLWRVHFQTRARVIPTPPEGTAIANFVPDESQVIADLRAIFSLVYILNKDAQIDDNALREFAEHNISYHAWPYWREWLQSTCARSGLPHIPLAMHLLKSARADVTPATREGGAPPKAE